MVKLSFNVYAYELDATLRVLRRGLDAAERGLAEEDRRVAAETAEIDQRIAAGAESGYRYDDDGDLDYDPHELLHYEETMIEETRQQVRKSLMVTLFHAWERIVRELTRKNKPTDNFEAVRVALQDQGIVVQSAVDELRKLANLVKHNSRQKARALWAVRPDLFYPFFDPDQHFPNDWEQAVRINAEQVDAFFAAVVASGPVHPPRLP